MFVCFGLAATKKASHGLVKQRPGFTTGRVLAGFVGKVTKNEIVFVTSAPHSFFFIHGKTVTYQRLQLT